MNWCLNVKNGPAEHVKILTKALGRSMGCYTCWTIDEPPASRCDDTHCFARIIVFLKDTHLQGIISEVIVADVTAVDIVLSHWLL